MTEIRLPTERQITLTAREQRRALNITAATLAGRLGVRPVTMTMRENGHRSITTPTLAAWWTELGLPVPPSRRSDGPPLDGYLRQIADTRRELGLSLSAAAALIGLCRSAYTLYETGKRRMPVPRMLDMYRALELRMPLPDTLACGCPALPAEHLAGCRLYANLLDNETVFLLRDLWFMVQLAGQHKPGPAAKRLDEILLDLHKRGFPMRKVSRLMGAPDRLANERLARLKT